MDHCTLDASLWHREVIIVVITSSFTKLPWPGDSDEMFWFLSQASTCPRVYHTRQRLDILLLNVIQRTNVNCTQQWPIDFLSTVLCVSVLSFCCSMKTTLQKKLVSYKCSGKVKFAKRPDVKPGKNFITRWSEVLTNAPLLLNRSAMIDSRAPSCARPSVITTTTSCTSSRSPLYPRRMLR